MNTDQRLARMERQCRLLKAGFALVTVALAAVLLIGAGQDQDKPKVLEEVRAKKFVVADTNGVKRVTIGQHRAGVYALKLLGEKGNPRIVLAHNAKLDLSLVTIHTKGGDGVTLTALGKKASWIDVLDSDGHSRVTLQSSPSPRGPRETCLCLHGENGQKMVELGVKGTVEYGSLTFGDVNGTDRLRLRPDGLAFIDRRKKPVAVFGSEAILKESEWENRRAEWALMLYDKSGKPIFQAPK